MTDSEKILKINSNFNAEYNYNNGKQYSYQIILQDNIQQLSNFIADKKIEFDLIIPKMKLNRNDNVKLREKILNVTPDGRKRLGINKSTLWHIKKNFSSNSERQKGTISFLFFIVIIIFSHWMRYM